MSKTLTNEILYKADLLKHKGNLDKANELYLRVIRKFPKNKRVFDNLVYINENLASKNANNLINLYNSGDFENVLNLVNKLITRLPYSYTILNIKGASLFAQNKFDEALVVFKKIISINPNFYEAYFNIGAILQKWDDVEQSIFYYKKAQSINPNTANTYYNIGVLENRRGNLKESLYHFNKAIQINPNFFQAYNDLGNLYFQNNKLSLAIKNFQNALKVNPNFVDALYNLGIVFHTMGDIDKAIENYKKCLDIDNNYEKAIFNLASAYKQKKDFNLAIDLYNKSLKLNPNNSNAHFNIGIIFNDIQNYKQAIVSYFNALEINPNCAKTMNNIGTAFEALGHTEKAIEYYLGAIKNKPDLYETYNNIGVALTQKKISKKNENIKKAIILMLDQKNYVRPQHISGAVISYIMIDPSIKKIINYFSFEKSKLSIEKVILELSKVEVLIKFMKVYPLINLELENFLIQLRKLILRSINSLQLNNQGLKFLEALALQCFTNEYIYPKCEEEIEKLTIIEQSIDESINKKIQPNCKLILCVAAYRPLHKYKWSRFIIKTPLINETFLRQIEEPSKENNLKLNIKSLEKISNTVSNKVKTQYEENPYPRWVNLGLKYNPLTISEHIKKINLKLFDNKLEKNQNPEILIAGCGTGQHAIEYASHLKNSSVLAIDLSLSSLAYAKRNTIALKIKNINYNQIDILNLEKLRKNFDIIQCVGVLHHMQNPMAGWRILKNCLKSGGLMKIGLYSSRARNYINQIRNKIDRLQISSTEKDMISFRESLKKTDDETIRKIELINDFYSLSDFRDLLFNVQEQTFDINQIQNCLKELNLKFCGFEGLNYKLFNLMNTQDVDKYSLDYWEQIEKENPEIFIGMYQFWCQKI